MSRNQKIRTLMAGCALIAAAAVILAVSGIFPGGIGYSYADADKYTAGETEISGAVRNLEVDWIDGEVRIEYHDRDTVLVRETSEKTISGDMQLRWWLDGDTLRIRYAKPGLRLNVNLQKKLTVTLPEGAELGNVSLEATSGDLVVPGMKAETLKLESTSGNITAEAETPSLRADTTSGDQKLKTTGTVKEIRAGSTSGSVVLEAENAEKAEAESTSGSVALTVTGKAESVRLHTTSGGILADVNEAGKLTAESTSGNLDVTVRKAGEVKTGSTSGSERVAAGQVEKLTAESTSGSVTALLPEKPGFTAQIHTASGSIENTLPLTVSGKKYVCGDGSAKVEIGTTSGDVRIEAWQE